MLILHCKKCKKTTKVKLIWWKQFTDKKRVQYHYECLDCKTKNTKTFK